MAIRVTIGGLDLVLATGEYVTIEGEAGARKGISGGRIVLETNAAKSVYLTETAGPQAAHMGIVGGQLVIDDQDGTSGIVGATILSTAPVPAYTVKKFIINGAIYEQHIDGPTIVAGGILAHGITLPAEGTGSTEEAAVSFDVDAGYTVTGAVVEGPATVEAATTYAVSANSTYAATSTAEATVTAAVDLASLHAATATAEATTTDQVTADSTTSALVSIEAATTDQAQAGFTTTGEIEAAAGLSNIRISAMHFQRHYEPIAVGS